MVASALFLNVQAHNFGSCVSVPDPVPDCVRRDQDNFLIYQPKMSPEFVKDLKKCRSPINLQRFTKPPDSVMRNLRERERESFGREIGLTVEMKVHFIEGDFL